jgi:hypothetical protein
MVDGESEGDANGVAALNGPASPNEPGGTALHTEVPGAISLMELEILSLRVAVRRLEEELTQRRADDVAKQSEYLLSKVETSLEVMVEKRARALVEEHVAHLTARIHGQLGALEAVIDQSLHQLVEERLKPLVEAKLVSVVETDIAPQVEARVVSLVKEGFPEVVKERFGKFLERIPAALNPVFEQRVDELAACVDERLERMDELIKRGNKLNQLQSSFAKHRVGGRSSSPDEGLDVAPDDDEPDDGNSSSTLHLADEDWTGEGSEEAEEAVNDDENGDSEHDDDDDDDAYPGDIDDVDDDDDDDGDGDDPDDDDAYPGDIDDVDDDDDDGDTDDPDDDSGDADEMDDDACSDC